MGAFPSVSLPLPEVGVSILEYAAGPGREGLVGLDVLPIQNVSVKQGTYGILPREAFTIIPENVRKSDGSYNRVIWDFETATYVAVEYGLEEILSDSDVAQYASLFDYQSTVATKLMMHHLMAQEVRIATLALAGVSGASAFAKWDVAATATPKADFDVAQLAILTATGLEADSVVIPKQAFSALLRTSEVKTALQYTQPVETLAPDAQKRMVADYFGVKNVLVPSRFKSSADKGQVFVGASIWDKTKVLLFKAAESGQGLKQPCFGLSMLWTSDSPDNAVTETYRDEARRADVLRVRHNVDEVIVSAALGQTINTVL